MQVDISTRSLVRLLGVFVLVLSLIVLAYLARGALGIILVSAFIAVATHRPVSFFERLLPFKSRKPAALIVFLIVGGVTAVGVYLLVPLITVQGRELAVQLPAQIEALRRADTGIGQWLESLNLFEYLEMFIATVLQGVVYSAEATISLVSAIITNLINIFFTVLLSFAMVVEGPRRIRELDRYIPANILQHVEVLRSRIYRAVSGFVNGQLLITSIAASATFILLSLIGVPAPLSLAAIIWLTGLIPLIGNTLGAVVVVLVALSQSLLVALFLIFYYLVYQQIENNFLEPLIQSRTVHITPLMVIVSAVVGVHMAGFIGALLAIPAGASLRIVAVYAIDQLKS